MAAPSPLNSGSLATRPPVRKGGVRRRDESPDAFRARMDGGYATNAPPTAVAPNRRDNILNARADGTFNAKRDAYNLAGQATGHSMDEAGNIAVNPARPPAPGAPPAGGTHTLSAPATAPTPRHTTGAANSTGIPAVDALSPQVSTPPPRPAAGAPFTSMPPGSRNLYAEEQQRQQTAQPAVTNNVTSNVTSPVTAAAPMTPQERTDIWNKGLAGQLHTVTPPAPQTTTPAGIPAPTFTGAAADRYNTAMTSLSGAKAPLAVNPARPQTPTLSPPQSSPAAPAPLIPGKTQVLNAATGAAEGAATALALPAQLAITPLKLVQSGTTAALRKGAALATQGIKQATGALTAAKNWWNTGSTAPVITPKTLATRPTAQRPQLTLGR